MSKMDTDIEIDLPPPISANALWSYSRAGVYQSKKYKQWVKNADALVMTQRHWRNKTIKGQFNALLIVNERQVRKSSDPDNYLKASLDYAKRIGLIVDDSLKYSRNPQVKFGDAPTGSRLILRAL